MKQPKFKGGFYCLNLDPEAVQFVSKNRAWIVSILNGHLYVNGDLAVDSQVQIDTVEIETESAWEQGILILTCETGLKLKLSLIDFEDKGDYTMEVC